MQHFLIGKILHAAAVVNAQLVCDLLRLVGADTMNVGKRDDNALVGGDVYPGNTSHLNLLLHRGRRFSATTEPNEHSQ